MSKFKMCEIPMRRGLSPEGKAIRERHQSSLTIGDFSVTTVDSKPSAPPMLLRSLEHSVDGSDTASVLLRQPLRQSCPAHPLPFRATHPLPSLMKGHSSSGVIDVCKDVERDGSAHSDYFSLNDEPHQPLTTDGRKEVTRPGVHDRKPSVCDYRNSGRGSLINDDYYKTERDVDDSRLLKNFEVVDKVSVNNYSDGNAVSRGHWQLPDSTNKAVLSTSSAITSNGIRNSAVNRKESLEDSGIEKLLLNNYMQRRGSNGSTSVSSECEYLPCDTGKKSDTAELLFQADTSNGPLTQNRSGWCGERGTGSLNDVRESNSNAGGVRVASRGSASDENIRSITDEAMAILGENIAVRQKAQKSKNQDLSADNPLLFMRQNSAINYTRDYNKPLARNIGNSPSSPTLKPIVNNSASSANFASNIEEHRVTSSSPPPDVITNLRQQLPSDPVDREPAYSCAKSLRHQHQQGCLASDLSDPVDDSSYKPCPNLVRSHLQPQDKSVSNMRWVGESKLVSLDGNYTSNGDVNNSPVKHNSFGVNGRSESTGASAENYSVKKTDNNLAESVNHRGNEKSAAITIDNKEELNPCGTYSLSSNHAQRTAPDPADCLTYINTQGNCISGNAEENTTSLGIVEKNRPYLESNFPHDSLLNRLQSGSSSLLLPATYPMPSAFTRSLRNSSSLKPRLVSGRGKPVRPSQLSSNIRYDATGVTPASISKELLQRNVSDVIAKIKQKKPACEVDYMSMKKSIERQHINMFVRDGIVQQSANQVFESRSSVGGLSDRLTARSTTSSSRLRSQSIDRELQRNQTNEKAQSRNTGQKNIMADTVGSKRNELFKTHVLHKTNSGDKSDVPQRKEDNKNFNNSYIRKSCSDLDLSITSNKYEVHTRLSKDIPQIDLQGDNVSLDAFVQKPLHDSLASCNIVNTTSRSSLDLKLPLHITKDSNISKAFNDLDNNKNTLELKLPSGEHPISTKHNTISNEHGNNLRRHSQSSDVASDLDSNSIRLDSNNFEPLVKQRAPHLDQIIEASSESGTASSARDISVANSGGANIAGASSEPCGNPLLHDDSYTTSTPRVTHCEQVVDMPNGLPLQEATESGGAPLAATAAPVDAHSGTTCPGLRAAAASHVRSRGASDTGNAAGQSHCSRRVSQRSNSSNNSDGGPAKPRSKSGEPPPSYKRGQVPLYLQQRRAAAARKQAIEDARDPACPPNHTPLPEQQRLSTLRLLHQSVRDVLQEIGALPLTQDTLRSRRRRQELEGKLEQLEDGIKIFSQPKVYVLQEEEEEDEME